MKSTTQIFKPLLRGAFLALAFAALGQAAAEPPKPGALPTTKEQCFNGGWQTYNVFKNQGDCVSFVATQGKPPAKAPPLPPPPK